MAALSLRVKDVVVHNNGRPAGAPKTGKLGLLAQLANPRDTSDAIIGTVRYGYANRINNHLGTGGNNPDMPELNPIRNYHILQFDLTYRF